MVKGRLPQGITNFRGRYRVRLDVDGRTQSLGVYETLGDAKAALDIAKGEAVRGTFVSPSQRRAARQAAAQRAERESITLSQWVQQWLADIDANPKRSRATVVSYRSVLSAHVLPTLGNVRMVDLTGEQVAELLAELRAQPSQRHPGSTLNGVAPNVARVLRSCLNTAVKRRAGGLTSFTFPDAPTHARVRPTAPSGEDIATPDQVAAMTAAMPEHLRISVPLAAWCALRIGEVLGLQRRDLEHLDEPARATLHVRRQFNVKAGKLTPPKVGSTRSIALPEFLLADLLAHLDAHTGAEPESPVLATQRGRVSQSALDSAWRLARTEAGLPTFRFHDLRHTGLTFYAQQGATLAELLHRGGHTDVTVALRYQHATAERDRSLTSRLNQVVSGRSW